MALKEASYLFLDSWEGPFEVWNNALVKTHQLYMILTKVTVHGECFVALKVAFTRILCLLLTAWDKSFFTHSILAIGVCFATIALPIALLSRKLCSVEKSFLMYDNFFLMVIRCSEALEAFSVRL